jgi:hypothetical protein
MEPSMSSRGAVFLMAIGMGVLSTAALLYWVALPPLTIERTADGVKVHVERLGEYNSALTEFVMR